MGSGVSILLQEWALDNDFIRFALAALIPLLFCVSLVRLAFAWPATCSLISHADLQFFSIQIIQNVSFA